MSTSNDKVHNYGIEILRAICCIAVITCHAGGEFCKNADIYSFNYYVGEILRTGTRFAVPVFVTITGYLCLPVKYSIRDFYVKAAKKIVVPTIIASIVYTLLQMFEYRHNLSKQVLTEIVTNFINGTPFYHLWYMYMIIGMYIAIPWISRILFKFDLKKGKLVAAVVITTILSVVLGYQTDFIWPVEFIYYLNYLLFGYMIKIEHIKIENKLQKLCIFIIFSISMILTYVLMVMSVQGKFPGMPDQFPKYYFFPLLQLSGYCLFALFVANEEKYRVPHIMHMISKYSYKIYLYHAFVLHMLIKVTRKIVGGENAVLCVTVWSAMSLAIVLACIKILKKIKECKL